MFKITCDGYPLYDVRDESLIVLNPKADLEANKVDSASFMIYKNHPYYEKLLHKKSVFEISDDSGIVFRGRMTSDSIDFYKSKSVDLEGAMGYFNDSIVRPFNFPEDFTDNAEYSSSENVIEFFLKWLIDSHNSQVQEFQWFKLGRVTVSDPNNYITRSNSDYASTWETLKSRLFESDLKGYLCIRYEEDGNYIDYLSAFELMNPQTIEIGKNLLDVSEETDSAATFTAVVPLGAEAEFVISEATDEKEAVTIERRLTIADAEDAADGEIDSDIVKQGDTLFSKSAVEKYGFIYAPISETTWDDVATVSGLLSHGVAYLKQTASSLKTVREFVAADLHLSDAEIQTFRINHTVRVRTETGKNYYTAELTRLSIDFFNPQNTKITAGEVERTFTQKAEKSTSETIERIQKANKDISETKSEVTSVRNQLVTETTNIINTCNEIIFSALEKYVETQNFEEFRETVESELKILSDEISMTFTTTTEQIENVNGEFQTKFTEIYKHISFSQNGISIGDGETGITLEIDNDMISFKKGGQQFGWWDGTDFHTGNIIVDVDERAQLGNFAFVPRSDGSLMFLKVR